MALDKAVRTASSPNAVVGELHGIELDAHRGLRAAADEDLADALDLRDLLRKDGVGHVVDLRLGNDVGRKRENEDRRIGRIGFAVARDFAAGTRASWLRAALMAACTSRDAASMSRLRSNWSVTEAEPSELVDVIWLTPAMRPNWRSSGVATAEAIVSGLPPGSPAPTPMTGKSTSGSEATGRTE